MSRRSRGRNSAHDVLKYSNPGKESWSGHGAFRPTTCTQKGNPRNPYDCQYGFAVTFTRAPFAVAFPNGLEGVAAGGARPRRMADSVRLVPRTLIDIGLFT
jgi:hypothetical protein